MIWETPIKIGNKKIKNRILFPPISPNWATPEGGVTERLLKFYDDISHGGCGSVVVCGTAVSFEGKGTDRSLCLNDENHLDGFKKLAYVIREKNNCFAAIQLMHVGGQGNPAFTNTVPVSPSGCTCQATQIPSKALSTKEIKLITNQFIHSAVLAAKAGFDCVELHLAHGYLLHEFLSRHTNKRLDRFGGSIDNRCRIVIEIIEGIKREVPDLTIGARVSGKDYLSDGLSMNINKELLPALEQAGINYFSVTAGIYETASKKHKAMGKGDFFLYSTQIKSIVSCPVIGVGKILSINAAEKMLSKKACDIVAIGRGLVADPSMILKEKKGISYNQCLECGECQYLRYNRKEMSCPQWKGKYA